MTYEKKSQIIQAFLQTPEGEERFQKLVLVLEDLFSCIDIDDFLDFTAHALAEYVAREEFESFTEEYKRRCVYDSVSLAS